MKPGISRSIVSAPLLGAILSSLVLAQADPPNPPAGPDPNRDRQQQRKRDGSGPRPAQPPAGEPNPQRLDRIFSALDANADGKIDRDEMGRKGPEIMRGLKKQADSMAPGAPGAPGRGQGGWCAQCPCKRGGFGMRGPATGKGQMREHWARTQGFRQEQGRGQGQGWGQRRGWGGNQTPAFQSPCRRGGFGRMGRMQRMQQMDRPQQGPQMAFRMLDANGDGRLEPPEIHNKIETLERLLARTERAPIGLDEFMGFRPPAGPAGPRP